LTVALLVFAALAVAGFYFFNQERDRHQSIAAKAQKLARENPDAEVFSPAADTDSGVKKK
jgi:hypothetical protein